MELVHCRISATGLLVHNKTVYTICRRMISLYFNETISKNYENVHDCCCSDLAENHEVTQGCTWFVVANTIDIIKHRPGYIEMLSLDTITCNKWSNRECVWWCIRNPSPNTSWIHKQHFALIVWDECILIQSDYYTECLKKHVLSWKQTRVRSFSCNCYVLCSDRNLRKHNSFLCIKARYRDPVGT